MSTSMWALHSRGRTSPEISDVLLDNKVPAAACAGAMAPCEVFVPAQNTGLWPENTSSFQASGVTTKIFRGATEILSDTQPMTPGDSGSQRSHTAEHAGHPSSRPSSSASRRLTVAASTALSLKGQTV